MNKKLIGLFFSLNLISNAKADFKTNLQEKLSKGYESIKDFAKKEKTQKAAKFAYTTLSAAHIINESINTDDNKKNDEDFLALLENIVGYYPNIITNILLHQKQSKKEKTQEYKKNIKPKDVIKAFSWGALSGLNLGLIVLANNLFIKNNKFNEKGMFNALKFNLFWNAPSAYITYRLAKNSVESFKAGYKKVK